MTRNKTVVENLVSLAKKEDRTSFSYKVVNGEGKLYISPNMNCMIKVRHEDLMRIFGKMFPQPDESNTEQIYRSICESFGGYIKADAFPFETMERLYNSYISNAYIANPSNYPILYHKGGNKLQYVSFNTKESKKDILVTGMKIGNCTEPSAYYQTKFLSAICPNPKEGNFYMKTDSEKSALSIETPLLEAVVMPTVLT